MRMAIKIKCKNEIFDALNTEHNVMFTFIIFEMLVQKSHAKYMQKILIFISSNIIIILLVFLLAN